jgi:cbb3-type cytochrome oxidase maturation protein
VNIIFVLIPLAVLLLAAAVWAFIWAVNHGQFDDLEGPAYRILFDDDEKGDEPNGGKDGDPGS